MWSTVAKYLLRSKLPFSVAHTTLKVQRNKCSPCSSLLYVSRWQHSAPVYEQACLSETIIRNVETLDAQRFVCVHWEDGGQSHYPYVWLRDNCQCPECFLLSAKARKLPIENLDVNTGLRTVNLTDTNKVSITWPDNHQSEFDAKWLKKRCFSKESRAEMQEELFLQEHQYWGNDLKIPTLSYEDVLRCDRTAYEWLCTLRKVGIVLLEGAPVKQGELATFGKRIGYMKHTFYG
ncbi:gamma-butyrobetaine dioxygenase [Bufo gargarizans]|uniref:gamma-butyrobetaine dioxygenase n=1 Tax=Bufo gargarizans TaxID=30331 RepID=UPI001CF0D9AE|nr:gamma-butyrobetaine dioxygenase [Bufo gargarizans]